MNLPRELTKYERHRSKQSSRNSNYGTGGEGLGCVWCSECVCARTACASLPVLVAHCEDFLHPVIHGFGEPAELLAFLLPAVTTTKNTVSLTGNIFQSHLTPQLFYADLHFQQVQVCRFGLYRGEDHHTHRLVLLRFSLPRLPVLCRHTAHFKTR